MYLTYSEYVEMGGTQARVVFDRFNTRVQSLITRLTHGRIEHENPIRSAVRYAAFDIISAMVNDSVSGTDSHEISSMSNDGVTITYAVNGSNPETRYARILRGYIATETDENGTPLMYTGVDA